MKGMLHGNDLIIRCHALIVGIALCDLQRALNGFGTAVGKEYLFHPGYRQKLLTCCNGRLIVKQVGDVRKLAHLLLHCVFHFVTAVSQSHNSNACAKIQVFLSVCIIQLYALAVVKHHRKTIVNFI